MAEDDEDLNPPDDILDDIGDAAIGHPGKRTPEQGIADMEARIKRLQRDLTYWLADDNEHRAAMTRSEIRDAELRLAEYRTQLSGLN